MEYPARSTVFSFPSSLPRKPLSALGLQAIATAGSGLIQEKKAGGALQFIEIVLTERLVLLGGEIQRPSRSHAGNPAHQSGIQGLRIRQWRGSGAAQCGVENRGYRILGI